jgi:transposase
MPNVLLTQAEREELEARVRSRSLRADDSRRARLLLMLADDVPYRSIQEALGCNPGYVSRWKGRFEADGLAGLYGRHQGRKAVVLTPRLEAKIIEKSRKVPSDGTTHWSTRRLAKVLGVSHMLVARVWARAGLKPHRIARYMASDDPEFETKAADIIGLYVNPPQHAAIFCIDEKTAI